MLPVSCNYMSNVLSAAFLDLGLITDYFKKHNPFPNFHIYKQDHLLGIPANPITSVLPF